MRVAERLAAETIHAIYVTKLQRTAQTAAPLAEKLGLIPRVDPDLHEVHLGEWEGGLLRRKAAEQDPSTCWCRRRRTGVTSPVRSRSRC